MYFSEKVSRHDMGTYTCIAKNNVPPTVSKNFKLTVNFVPQIEVTNQVVGAPVGTNIILRCNIQASPKPMTFWSKKSGKKKKLVSRKNYLNKKNLFFRCNDCT